MKKRLFSIVYMFIITLIFTSIVTITRHFTHDLIELNEQAKMKGIILNVFGIAADRDLSPGDVVELFNSSVLSFELNNRTVYAAMETDGKSPKGYAFQISGPGFWGPIHAIAAVDATAKRMLGVRFYSHVETPGLGARISEQWFTQQFESLLISESAKNGKVFTLHRPGKAHGENQLNAITGATMTSQAVEAFLNRELLSFANNIRDEIRKDKDWPRLKT
jgi:Na+-transporting NADH:ubiquinone oxidoreductase subunit C